MKKVLLLLTAICGLSIGAFAQSSESGKFSIGVEAGLPIGDVSDATNLVIGGSLKYEHPVADKTFITGSAGYNKFLNNDAGKASDYNLYAIPVKVGVKYFFAENFYGEAQVGAAFAKESVAGFGGNTTAFAYAPGIGYSFGNVDLGVRYEAWSKNGTISQVGLRLGFSF